MSKPDFLSDFPLLRPSPSSPPRPSLLSTTPHPPPPLGEPVMGSFSVLASTTPAPSGARPGAIPPLRPSPSSPPRSLLSQPPPLPPPLGESLLDSFSAPIRAPLGLGQSRVAGGLGGAPLSLGGAQSSIEAPFLFPYVAATFSASADPIPTIGTVTNGAAINVVATSSSNVDMAQS